MSNRAFKQLNKGWNANPNDPDPVVTTDGTTVRLTFFLNPWAYDAAEEETGCLIFQGCSKWRLGPTNDEGWYRGQCRYSKVAPVWGEFYEILGDDDLRLQPSDWRSISPLTAEQTHFLFYLKDGTFECFAVDWTFERSAEHA